MKKSLLGIAFLSILMYSHAQSGQLDPSFGINGIVKTDMGAHFDYSSSARQVLMQTDGSIFIICNNPTFISKRLPNGAIDSSYGVNGYSRAVFFNEVFAAFQSDGKIVIEGYNYKSAGIARINTNGTLDSSFGMNGIQNTLFIPNSICVKNNGKIVVTESADSGFIIHQFNTNGNPDNTFNGTGKSTADFVYKTAPPRGSVDSAQIHTGTATKAAIQADGKILVGGFMTASDGINNFAIVRFNVDGSIDSTFDEDGKQTTLIGNGNSIAYSLVVQTDEKIILAGYTFTANTTAAFALVRYTANGKPDSSFNSNGKQVTQLAGTSISIGNSVAVASNGKIFIAGYTFNGFTNDFAVACFNADGSADNTFGNAGLVTTDINSSDDFAGSVSIAGDNKIVIAGYSDGAAMEHFAVTKYNTDGTLDASFGNNGKLIGDYYQGNTVFNASILQPDGKILVAGTTWNGTNTDFAIARYNNNGTPDKTFGNNGRQITDFGRTEIAVSIALQTDGKIVVGGNSNDEINIYQFAVARYNTDGTLDNTFNLNGKLVLSALGKQDFCRSIALQEDSKIVLAGFTVTGNNYDQNRFAIARLNIDGSLDNTFSADGKQLTDFNGAESFATSVVIQNDKKIVVAGRCFLNNQNNFCLARYNIDGSLDNSFSGDGIQINLFGPDSYFVKSMALQKDGKIVLAGYSEIRSGAASSFFIARYNINGDLDKTFNSSGFQTTSVGPNFDFANSLAILNDGRIAVGGTNDNFAIVLYKSDGSLDNTFGENGIKISGVALFDSRIQSIFFDQDKLYATGYGLYPGSLGVVARYLLAEGGPLPVTLLDFNAHLQNDKTVLLQWQTESEQNLSGFIVQRSFTSNNFSTIGYVPASGNNNLKINYSAPDNQPLQGVNFYRLKMVDVDGKFTYSKIVSVNIAHEIFTFQISPNPAKNILFVKINGGSGNGEFQITDISGRKLIKVIVSLNCNTAFSININSLPKGIYNLLLITKNKTETRRFIKE